MTVIGGLASFGFPKQFRADSMRTLDSPVDLRWGPDGKGFRRLVHPNGVCLTGRWTIDAETPYTGYFATGSTRARRRPLLHLLHRDAPRADAIAVARRQAVSDHRSVSPDAAAHRQLLHAGRHRRRQDRIHQRRRAAQRARHHAGQSRRGHSAADDDRASSSATSISSRRCGSSIRSRSSASRRARRRGPRSSCACSWRRSSRGFPARTSTSATR